MQVHICWVPRVEVGAEDKLARAAAGGNFRGFGGQKIFEDLRCSINRRVRRSFLSGVSSFANKISEVKTLANRRINDEKLQHRIQMTKSRSLVRLREITGYKKSPILSTKYNHIPRKSEVLFTRIRIDHWTIQEVVPVELLQGNCRTTAEIEYYLQLAVDYTDAFDEHIDNVFRKRWGTRRY